jgi:branched-chain amino acid transport system permease protein
MVALAVIVLIVSYLVKRSKFGLGLAAIREDEDAAIIMGVRAPSAKTWAFVLSAIVPGVIGTLYFFKNGNIEPADAFRLHLSIEMLVMVMLGGQGTVLGPLLGAAAYERLRIVLQTKPAVKDLQLTLAGRSLLLIVLFIPAGVVGWLRARLRWGWLRGLLE